MLFETIKSGAQGYLVKNLEADDFARPAEAKPDAAEHDALTDREREVLELMVEGVVLNRKLAKSRNLGENTVKFHVCNILDKLHLHERAEAVGHALRKPSTPARNA